MVSGAARFGSRTINASGSPDARNPARAGRADRARTRLPPLRGPARRTSARWRAGCPPRWKTSGSRPSQSRYNIAAVSEGSQSGLDCDAQLIGFGNKHMPLTDKQRRLYGRANGILLDEIPQEDAHEWVGLLTVIADIRPVALFLGVEEPDRLQLERVFQHSEVKPIIAPGPATAYTWESHNRPGITSLFRERDDTPSLWLCHSLAHARAISDGMDQVAAGVLLRYPQCCIDAQQREKARFESVVIAGYIRAFGEDTGKINRALLEDRKVEIDWEDDYRVQRTTARFPFVQHIACGACLNSESSPTDILNSEYRQLVEDVDRHLSDYLLRVAKRVEDDLRKSVDSTPP